MCLCSSLVLYTTILSCLSWPRAPRSSEAIQHATAAPLLTRSQPKPTPRATPSSPLLPRAATPPPFPPRHTVSQNHRLRATIPYHPSPQIFPALFQFSPRLVISHHRKTPEPDSILRRPLCFIAGGAADRLTFCSPEACAIRGCRLCRRAARSGGGSGRRPRHRRPHRLCHGRARPRRRRTTTACARPRRTGARSGAGCTAAASSGGAAGRSRTRRGVLKPGRRCTQGWRRLDGSRPASGTGRQAEAVYLCVDAVLISRLLMAPSSSSALWICNCTNCTAVRRNANRHVNIHDF